MHPLTAHAMNRAVCQSVRSTTGSEGQAWRRGLSVRTARVVAYHHAVLPRLALLCAQNPVGREPELLTSLSKVR
jgi:hypothetical protein